MVARGSLTRRPPFPRPRLAWATRTVRTLSGGLVEWIQARPHVLQQVRSAISVGRTAHDVGEAVRHELLGLYCDEIDIPDLRGVDWTQVGSRFPFN